MRYGQKKRSTFSVNRLGIWICLYLLLPVFSPALEIGQTFGLGNLFLSPNDEATDIFDGKSISYFGCSAWLKHDFQFHDMRFDAQYVYDPILRNIITTRFINKWDIFSFGVGPFFGVLNYMEKWWLPKMGISSFFHIEWPGILFAEMRIDNSMFAQLKEDGDYLQSLSLISLGIYVPHVICSFNILNKQFVERMNGMDIKDSITEYKFTADMYKKNVPFKILLSFAYLLQSREFGSTTAHTLGSVVLGLRLDTNITDSLTLILDSQNSIYTFGLNGLLGDDIQGWGGYLAKLDIGFSLDLSKIMNSDVNTQK